MPERSSPFRFPGSRRNLLPILGLVLPMCAAGFSQPQTVDVPGPGWRGSSPARCLVRMPESPPPSADRTTFRISAGEKEKIVLRLHILRRSNGTGGLTDLVLLDEMIKDLNHGFRNTPWVFVAHPEIIQINNDAYYTMEKVDDAWALFRDYYVPGTLSIFFSEQRLFGPTAARAYASYLFPRGLIFADVVGWPYDTPYPPHELGHLLSLYHPFETQFGTECADGSNCMEAGDLVCDTPASPAVFNGNTTATGVYYGTALPPCPGDPPYGPRTDLYMESGWAPGHAGYLYRSAFSDGQVERMAFALDNFSSDLLGPARPEVLVDCDGDQVDDIEAIAAGAVPDLNRDMIPDGCQAFPDPGDLIVCGMTPDLSNRPRYYDAETGQYRGALWSGAWWMHAMRLNPDDGYVYIPSLTVVQRLSLETGRLVDNFVDGVLDGAGTFVDLLFDPSGDLLILDNVSSNIRRYSASDGSFLGVLADVGATGMTSPKYMEYGPDGNICVVGNGTLGNTIQRFDGESGAALGSLINPGAGGLFTGQGIILHTDGDFYVSNGGPNSVIRYDGVTGEVKDIPVSPGSGGLSNPHGLAFGPDGHLYVASRGTNSVKRYHGLSGAYLGNFVAPGSGGSPGSGGLIAPAGLLFVPPDPVAINPELPEAPPPPHAVHPNPFKVAARISFSLDQRKVVRLEILDINGRLVQKLHDGDLAPGPHEFGWQGNDAVGSRVAAGVYFYRLRRGARVDHGKIIRLP